MMMPLYVVFANPHFPELSKDAKCTGGAGKDASRFAKNKNFPTANKCTFLASELRSDTTSDFTHFLDRPSIASLISQTWRLSPLFFKCTG